MAHVLIIEDNADNLELMSYLLESFGHSTSAARDGARGLLLARQCRPNLIICDIQMHLMDGYAVAALLKQDEQLRSVPLVAVTALAMMGDRARILNSGFDSYISKPIDPQRFVADLEALLHISNPSASIVLPVEHSPHVPPPGSLSGSILVVDDTATNRELMRETLQPFGYEVWLADSVDAAIGLIERQKLDLVISDLHMPEADGFRLIREIKSKPQLETLPLMLLSSSSWNDRDRERAYAMGVVRFLLRPIEPAALIAEIEACLRRL